MAGFMQYQHSARTSCTKEYTVLTFKTAGRRQDKENNVRATHA